MRGSAEAGESVEDLIKIAREASESFGKAREFGPDREHAYISEVQMLIDLVDQVGRKQAGPEKDVIRMLTRSTADPLPAAGSAEGRGTSGSGSASLRW